MTDNQENISMAPDLLRNAIAKMPDFVKSTEYTRGLDRQVLLATLPGTIEDEIPPVSQAFVDKVKAMGGLITARGLVCDPDAPVEGKRYMRVAKAFFTHLFNDTMRHVEDAEFRIRSYALHDKKAPDWDKSNAYFVKCLQHCIKMRHHPGRKPVYALKVNVPARDLVMLEKAGDFPISHPFKE